MSTAYRIFPSIGVARLGADGDFFVGPEMPGGGPTEATSDESIVPVTRFKDNTRTKIRKQGARFHLFESRDALLQRHVQRHRARDRSYRARAYAVTPRGLQRGLPQLGMCR